MRRALVAAAVSGAVALTASACELPDLPGIGGTQDTKATPKPGKPARQGITPRYPALLTHDTRPATYRIINNEGGIDLRQGRVRFHLTYHIETTDFDDWRHPEAVKDIKEVITEEGAMKPPGPFVVGKARGFVGEVHAFHTQFGKGAYRLYSVPFASEPAGGSKRYVTITLLVFDPKKRQIGAAHRAMADRLMKSVRLNRSWQGNQPRGRQIGLIVPFDYVRPPGLSGGEEVNEVGPLEIELTFGEKAVPHGARVLRPDGGVRIEFERRESLRATQSLYQGHRRYSLAPGLGKDLRKVPGLREPTWIDKGHKGGCEPIPRPPKSTCSRPATGSSGSSPRIPPNSAPFAAYSSPSSPVTWTDSGRPRAADIQGSVDPPNEGREMPRTVDAGALREFAAAVAEAYGIRTADAWLLADSLVTAELWGHPSHGMLRLSWYLDRVRSGATATDTEPEIVSDTGAVLVVDGHDGLGQVITDRAVAWGVERAKLHGVAVVGIRDSGHFGTAAYFTRKAAARGCVAILVSNASPAMAPWGGKEKRLGTNPWSIAAPGGRYGTVVMDIANTAVARGKIYHAKERGEPIPEGWAADSEGVPTTDPARAIEGLILPMAGHKGYAIAFMVDVLAGVLTGSGFGTRVVGPYVPEGKSAAGHLLICIDTAALGDPADFEERTETLVAETKDTPTAAGVAEVFVPGEPEARTAERLRTEGITLADETWATLTGLAERAGVPLPSS